MFFIQNLRYDSLILQFKAVTVKVLVDGYLVESFWCLLLSNILAIAFLMISIRGIASLIFVLLRSHHSFLVCLGPLQLGSLIQLSENMSFFSAVVFLCILPIPLANLTPH